MTIRKAIRTKVRKKTARKKMVMAKIKHSRYKQIIKKPVSKKSPRRVKKHPAQPKLKKTPGYIPFDLFVEKLKKSKRKQNVLDVTDYPKEVSKMKLSEKPKKRYVPLQKLLDKLKKSIN